MQVPSTWEDSDGVRVTALGYSFAFRTRAQILGAIYLCPRHGVALFVTQGTSVTSPDPGGGIHVYYRLISVNGAVGLPAW